MTMLGHQLLILGRIDLLVDQIQPPCTLVGQIQPACTFVDQQDTIFLAQDARLRPVLQSHSALWGISRIRSFWLRMQDHVQYFRAAILNPIITTTTPPYYSVTTYHPRQIYASTVALKSALKIVPHNFRSAKMNTPHLDRLRVLSSSLRGTMGSFCKFLHFC
jgi:hypothetical protein